MAQTELLSIDLKLFGEGAGGDGGGATAAQGETNGTVPGSTRQGKSGEFANVIFGKQNAIETSATEAPAAEEQTRDSQVTSNTLEDRRKAFNELVNGEYKDIYTAETQRIIDRRFKETKNLEAKVAEHQPLMDLLAQRYGVTDGDVAKLTKAIESDDAYWATAAEEAGMTVEQYKQFSRLQRENKALMEAQQQRQNRDAAMQTMQKWMADAEATKAKYPGFDVDVEAENPAFMSMLKSGVPMEHAYKVLHMDEIVTEAMSTSAAQAEKRVVENVRAKGARPAENGVAAQSGFVVKDDVSKLSRKERAEIARRAMRGETISF